MAYKVDAGFVIQIGLNHESIMNHKISIKCPRCMKSVLVEQKDGKPLRGQKCRNCGFIF